jgi:hypothetical protein
MPQFWKGEGPNGFRVRYSGGEADLVFIDQRAFAVLEWGESGAAMVTIELDTTQLHAVDTGGSVYDYSAVLIDPR